MKEYRVAVVIPCYRVSNNIVSVIQRIGEGVDSIYVIDDKCPEKSGHLVEEHVHDRRVKVLFNGDNEGVGGATIVGIRKALEDNAQVIAKLDGDGQMDPSLLDKFTRPILDGDADYTKGNRFFNVEDVSKMPKVRLIGNALLSFFAKLSTGYWQNFDPTNGYIAMHRKVAEQLPLAKVNKRYFFETDLLFRLNTLRAVVVDIPMLAVYENEKSSLKIRSELPKFAIGHMKSFIKRIFYNYFLRNFSVASLELVFGLAFILFGVVFGAVRWFESSFQEVVASPGTVMLAALPIILGTQFLLAFFSFDMESVPKTCIHKKL